MTDDSQAIARVRGNASNQDLFSILFFSTDGSAFYFLRKLEGTIIEDGAGHTQQTWAALREKVKWTSRDAIRAEHARLTTRQCAQDRVPTSTSTSWTAAATASTRVTDQGVQQIAKAWIIYVKLLHQIARSSVKLTWRKETSALPISDV